MRVMSCSCTTLGAVWFHEERQHFASNPTTTITATATVQCGTLRHEADCAGKITWQVARPDCVRQPHLGLPAAYVARGLMACGLCHIHEWR